MSFNDRREALLSSMEENSIALLYAGSPAPANEDEYLPFVVNSNFFYLTGLSRAGMVLMLVKAGGKSSSFLFIEETDEFTERWTGKMPTKDEVTLLSGVDEVYYLPELDGMLSRVTGRSVIETAYFDVYRCDVNDLPTENIRRADEFAKKCPGVRIRDLHILMEPLRKRKDAEEIEAHRRAINITKKSLDAMARSLKPGMKEYQAQAIFEGACKWYGAPGQAFPTIAAAGANACSMHYSTNRDEMKDGDLILFDLGAGYGSYCADISRTYPVNGKFSPRQREFYELVLKANRAVAEKAAPGVTIRQLQELTRSVLGEGMTALGMIDEPDEIGKYYMHGVSHSIGIDTHDIDLSGGGMLVPGMIISDEPGLYIDEEGIGIRIEDDLLITEDGCEVLSIAIPKDPDEIEALMAQHFEALPLSLD